MQQVRVIHNDSRIHGKTGTVRHVCPGSLHTWYRVDIDGQIWDLNGSELVFMDKTGRGERDDERSQRFSNLAIETN